MSLPHQSYTETQLFRVSVVKHDGPLRFLVPSRRPKTAPYLVELDAYHCNGRCVCKHFVTRLEPLLSRGLDAETALVQKQAKIPPWGTAEDALRCFHIHAARLKFADDVIKAIHDDQKKQAIAAREAARQEQPAPEPF